MTTMTTQSKRKYHEENAELWELLRRCQNRLDSIDNREPPKYNLGGSDTNHSRIARRRICGEKDEADMYGSCRKKVMVVNSTSKEILELKNNSISSVQRNVLRDFQREHREVLDLLERSKERLSRIDFSKLGLESPTFCLEEDDGVYVKTAMPRNRGVIDLYLQKQPTRNDSWTDTTIESMHDQTPGNFFYDEDSVINYNDHRDDDQMECNFFGFTFKFLRKPCPSIFETKL